MEAILLLALLTHGLSILWPECYLDVSAICSEFFGKASKEKKQCYEQVGSKAQGVGM